MRDRREIEDELRHVQDRAIRAKTVLGEKQREYQRLYEQQAELEAQISALASGVRVSDHAVIRYLERKHGFSFNDVRDKILNDTTRAAIEMGATAITVDGAKFLVRDRCVVTCLN